MVVTVSHQGYVKRLPVGTYRAQRRGGRGLRGMETKDEDWVEHMFVASTHDYLMIFTRRGMCYWKKVWEIPVGGRTSRGKPIVNLLNVSEDEQIAAVVPVREFRDDQYLLFGTRLGVMLGSETRLRRVILKLFDFILVRDVGAGRHRRPWRWREAAGAGRREPARPARRAKRLVVIEAEPLQRLRVVSLVRFGFSPLCGRLGRIA